MPVDPEQNVPVPTTPSPDGGEGGEPAPDTEATEAVLDEALLGGPRTLTVERLAERAGVGTDRVRAYWQALGLP